MISFIEFLINEGKVLNVAASYQGNPDVKVFYNPHNNQIKNQPWKTIRVLKHGKDHYVWNGHDAIHSQIINSLGLEGTERSYFTKGTLDRRNGDYKKAHQDKHDPWLDKVNEGRVINIEDHPYADSANFAVYRNPTKEQIRNKPWKEIRVLKHGKDHYVWNAYDATHSDVSDSLGVPFKESEKSILTKKFLDKHNGDYKEAHKNGQKWR